MGHIKSVNCKVLRNVILTVKPWNNLVYTYTEFVPQKRKWNMTNAFLKYSNKSNEMQINATQPPSQPIAYGHTILYS